MKTGCCHTKVSLRIEKHNAVCLNTKCENYLGRTNIYRDFSSWRKPIAISVFAVHLLFSAEDFSMENKERTINDLQLFSNKAPLSIENLRSELKKQNILCSDEVLAQMQLESAGLNSSLLKRTNNMMGMRYPFSRPTAACGIYLPAKDTIILGDQKSLKKYAKQSHYAVFECWQDAVSDYKLWQDYNFKVKERYLTYLGQVYAEDTFYVNKIKRMAAK